MPRGDDTTLPLRLPPPKTAGGEWLGGRTIAPFWVMEGGPLRPEISIWIEQPGPLVVAMAVADPRTPCTPFAETLRAAMLNPLVLSPLVAAAAPDATAHLPQLCGVGCEPGALSLEDSHTATLRWTVPFMLRYVAQKPSFGKLLRARGAPPGVVVETARAS